MAMVPEGLDMAVRLMTPGEVSRVRAAPSYAYAGRADRPEVRLGKVLDGKPSTQQYFRHCILGC